MPDRIRSWWSRTAPVLMALVLAAFAAPGADAQPDPAATCRGRPAQTEVRPLDPLTQAECIRAVRAVVADARTREVVTGRQFDVAYVEVLSGKGRDGQPVRQAEVMVSVFDGQPTGVRAVVDLARGTVTEVSRAAATRAQVTAAGPGRAELVPISPAEVALARGLATRDAAFRSRIGMAAEEVTVEVLPVTEPDETCPSGRCVELLFRRGREYSTTTAVVDVSSRAVRYRGVGRQP
jgi:hypothetical protein